MSASNTIKLVPRNVAALRRQQSASDGIATVSGNPVSTRLESGVGNCFPGLECDLRNLERRFFPFLEVDISDNSIQIVIVDATAVEQAATAGSITAATRNAYRELAQGLTQGRTINIVSIKGRFGPFGSHTLQIDTLNPPSSGVSLAPPDAWTAVRLLEENADVTLSVRVGTGAQKTLKAKRAAYLSTNGSLAAMFEPGELTQSLCSPWTHDFRDCGCFYWASNHPDIVLPPTPDASEPTQAWNAPVPWERLDRSISNTPPAPANSNEPVELGHYAINHQWQSLNFVLEGRETIRPYRVGMFNASPLATMAELEKYLRYAAGVELAAIQEYLSAAYSLIDPASVTGTLRDNISVAFAELMRISFGEMRHLRAVNDVLQSLFGSAYVPALRVAKTIPSATGGQRPVHARVLDPQAVTDFLAIEQPNISVDGLYSTILATLRRFGFGTDADYQTIRSVMAGGEDHYETFENIQEWLRPFQPNQYLHSNLTPAPPTHAAYAKLQLQYRNLLDALYIGYAAGLPQGASSINAARAAMVAPTGFGEAIRAVVSAGFLAAFDPINDPRFQAIDPP